jgi:hypothetical protein
VSARRPTMVIFAKEDAEGVVLKARRERGESAVRRSANIVAVFWVGYLGVWS